MLKKIKFRSLNIDITSVIIDDAWGFKLNSEKYHFNFRGWLSCNMSGSNAKKSMIKWHTGWLGETDANGDLVFATMYFMLSYPEMNKLIEGMLYSLFMLEHQVWFMMGK